MKQLAALLTCAALGACSAPDASAPVTSEMRYPVADFSPENKDLQARKSPPQLVDMNEYVYNVRRKIKNNIAYDTTKITSGNPSALVLINLFPNGEVRSVEFSEHSHIPGYDAAIAAAITKSSPFPKPESNPVPRVFKVRFFMFEDR